MINIAFMRNAFFILMATLMLPCVNLSAQVVFWSEDFGAGCNDGNLASAYSGANGAWTIVSTGTNVALSNTWYVSASENGNPAGSCGTGCGSDRSLHVGNVDIMGFIPPDGGARYYAGGLGDATTNRRAESPVINCTGRSSITLSFVYMENGSGTLDNATLWYYNGSVWAQLTDLAKTATSCGGGQGLWTAYSITLPASADNNPNVKLGFNWTNNNDVSGTDPSFAVDDISLSVPSAGTPPVANFSSSDTTICTGTCLTFTDLSTNTPTSWAWTFAGAATLNSSLQNPTGICYNTAGNFQVELTATNASGSDVETKVAFIHVVDPPAAGISGDNNICNGESTILTASGGGTYSWSTTASTAAITVSPSSNASYTVTVSNGTCTSSASINVTVNALPNVTISGTTTICSGDNTTLTGNNASSYEWSTTETTPAIIVSPAGNTTYIVTGTDGNGCENTASVMVTVTAPPVALITGNTSVCAGEAITLTANGTGTYLWSTGETTPTISPIPGSNITYSLTVTAGTCNDRDSIDISVLAPPVAAISGDFIICNGDFTLLTGSGGGTYDWGTSGTGVTINVNPSSNTTYILTVNDGFCEDTAMATVYVNPLPNINISGASEICVGDNVVLTAAGGTSYIWNTTETTPTITDAPLITTTYTVTGSDGTCSNSASISVTVSAPPTALISGDNEICQGTISNLVASGGGTYSWNNGIATANNSVSPLTSTTYIVTVSIGSCSDTASIFLTVFPLPPANAGNDTLIYFGGSAQLNGSGGTIYQWSPTLFLDCFDCQTPVASPETTTWYYLMVTDANGCIATDSVLVRVEYNCGDVFLPNAFSPNNDGYNDEFRIRGNCIVTIDLKIYDRWGEKVFETNDPLMGWNGEFDGSPMNPGVFHYTYSGTLLNEEIISGKGNVTLVR